jgi:hypothetical protein
LTNVADLPLCGAGGEPVDFARTIVSHGVAELPPNHVDLQARRLETTLPVACGARTVRITESGGKLRIQAVAGSFDRRLVETVAHMFRLDENLSGFYAVVAADGELSWCATGAGRMLRAPTVFEDVVKTKRTLIRTSARIGEPQAKRDLQGLLQVHILGLELVKLRERFRRRLEASVEVEAHGVERRRCRDDHCRVAPFAGQAFELLAEVLADALSSVPAAHVEEGELRDSRPDVRPDDPDPDELAIRKRSQRDSTCGEMALALGALVSDRVVALPFGEPRRGAEIAEPPVELVAVLHVQGVDSFGSINVADPLEV